MSTPAQRVHLKLISLLTVRTIPARKLTKPDNGGGGYGTTHPRKSSEQIAQTERLHARIIDLYRAGLKRYEIAKRLKVASVTVWCHLKSLQP